MPQKGANFFVWWLLSLVRTKTTVGDIPQFLSPLLDANHDRYRGVEIKNLIYYIDIKSILSYYI